MKSLQINCLLLIFVALFAFSCSQSSEVYLEFEKWDEGFWPYDAPVTFDFTIPQAEMKYEIELSARYGGNYRQSNLFVKYDLMDSSGSIINAEIHEMTLFDKETPVGNGASSVFLKHSSLIKDYQFPYAGPYSLKVRHYMREDTLQHMLAIGLTIREVEQ